MGPASVTIDGVVLEFKLPDGYPGSGVPTEYERFESWGWRFKSNSLMNGTEWLGEESREGCEAAAREDAADRRQSEDWCRWAEDVRGF